MRNCCLVRLSDAMIPPSEPEHRIVNMDLNPSVTCGDTLGEFAEPHVPRYSSLSLLNTA